MTYKVVKTKCAIYLVLYNVCFLVNKLKYYILYVLYYYYLSNCLNAKNIICNIKRKLSKMIQKLFGLFYTQTDQIN